MTIQEAIKILHDLRASCKPGEFKDPEDALQLGIEALKRVSDMRISPCTTADEILPGETEE